MAIAPGTKPGPYEVLGPLGAGGMGEVYRARDTRLGRAVAIKVLPESLTKDRDRLRRFEQEARAVAALNHRNILAFHKYSPDSKYIVYLRARRGRGSEIMAKPLQGGGEPMRVVGETGPQPSLSDFQISPNGKWIAYQSDESGTFEVYIAPFPKGEGRWQVSSGGGNFPSWRGDSRELFSITPTGDVYATEITQHGVELQVGTPKLLFHTDNVAAIGNRYDASPNGQSFVVQRAGDQSHDALNLVTNWKAELKR
jgi:Tol biopolymer transport system component